MNEFLQRLDSPTPEFFKKLRKIALIVGTLTASVLLYPVALPAIVVTTLTVVGSVAGTVVAVTSLTKEDNVSS